MATDYLQADAWFVVFPIALVAHPLIALEPLMFALINVSLSSWCRSLSLGLLFVLTTLPLFAAQPKVTVTWSQPTTITYGASISTPATATAGGVTVPGTFVYTPALGTIPNAGTTRATAIFTPAAGGAQITTRKNIRVNQVTVTVTSRANKLYQAALPVLVPEYSGFVHGDTQTTILTGTPQLSTTATASSPVGNYPITVKKGSLKSNANYKLKYVAGTLKVTPASATITLGALNQVYNGASHSVSITTTPANLATSVTYAGGTTAPTNVGSYAVVANITDPNYSGTANGTLEITKVNATMVVDELNHIYDGNGHSVIVSTTPPNLTTSIVYDGTTLLPVDAGTYPVVVTITDDHYVGTVNRSMVIAKADAQIILGDLDHTYDGTRHAVSLSTVPDSLPYSVTYDNGSILPVNAGTYAVKATINAPNHQGSASGFLTIAQANQTISLAALHDVVLGDADQPVTATVNTGLPISFTVTGPGEIVNGFLHVTDGGTVTVTASQVGDANHLPVTSNMQSITVTETGGLLASYYANETLSGDPVLVRREPKINHDWSDSSPAIGVPADLFSVRWDGEIQPRFNEAYTLTFRTDDGVRVWLDGQLVVNYWNLRSVADSEYTFSAVAGRRYRIRIEYYEHTGLAVAQLWWRSASETFGPVPSTQLFPTPPDTSGVVGTGNGLTASYFANEMLTGTPMLTRIDAGVYFDWAGGSPASEIPEDSFSARWSGEIQPRYTEPYTITMRTDDGVRVWLDGQLVINDWILRAPADSSYTFNAEAGRHYAIRIEYYEHTGGAVAQLNWYSAREFSGAIPAAQLYPLPTPVVSAADIGYAIAEGEAVTLSGTVSNVGAAAMTYAWSQVSGPATATFLTSDTTTTIARFPLAGSYEIALSAFNGHLTISDSTIVTVVASDVSHDLVAHYKFDETSGDKAFDASGKQHTGKLYGATRTAGKSQGALRFTGTSYVYVQGNEDLDLPTQALTLAVWLKPDRSLADMAHPFPMPIYRADYATSVGYGLMVTVSETDQFGLRLHHRVGSGQRIEIATPQPLVANAWVHLAGVYDGTTMTLYRNGAAVATRATGAMTVRNAGEIAMFLGRGFEGLMDDVRIYHRALNRTDVVGLAQGGLDRREPGANAGVDQVVTLLAPTTTLAGSASDDAGSGTTLVPTWTQISGPAPATISDSHALNPNVTFNVTGSYRFQLSVSDGVLSGRDDMRIEVTDGTVDLATGLVLHYRCDEGSGTLVADTSGFAQNATFYGLPQWSDNGQFLGAVNMNGTSQIIAPSPTPLTNLTRITLSVWMRGNRPIVDMVHSWPSALYHADYATNRGFALMTTATDTNTFGFRLHTGTGRREVTMDGVPSGAWVHVVATYDGQVMRLFRDGVLVEINATGSIPLPAFDARLQIGIGYEGMFDDIRIYNRALSPTEVQSLHIVPPIGANG
jgi:PA14 domain/MBG domain/Concanavalin A-like lectin/glucanases superfamily/MBG domain (YGX type)